MLRPEDRSRFHLLVVDDEASQRQMLEGFLRKRGFRVSCASSGEEALERLREASADVVLTDYKMPGLSGQELLERLKALNPKMPVIIFTAYGTVERAVEAMRAGATDYLTKPIELELLAERLDRVLERSVLVAEVEELRRRLAERVQIENIVGESSAMQEVLSLVERVAPSETTVLIRGESGTGKELIAQAIHARSPRSEGPFVRVNIAALPETLLESELFGHERGAFTGAEARRIGRFEAAQGGTIFLDEIGDLSGPLQVKLLRVLQERVIERLGSQEPVSVDVRVLAATHRDLERLVAEGRFREDLYYRLNVFPIYLPPLRERRQDIPLLVEYLLGRIETRTGKRLKGVSKEALDRLLRYDYPGNVRELENILERAALMARRELIYAEDLPAQLRAEPEAERQELVESSSLPQAVEALERLMIQRALERHGGVQTRAAQELGISERVLRYKLKKYGLG